MMEAVPFIIIQWGSDRMFFEVVEAAMHVLDEKCSQISADAVAYQDALDREILAVGWQ